MNKAPPDSQRRKSTAITSILGHSISYRSNKSGGAGLSGDKDPLGLKNIYTPLEEKVVADLVFVHGLGGGSR